MKKITLKEVAEKEYNESVQEVFERGAIIVTDKDQANQIFEEMKGREVDRLNFNRNEIKKILTKVGDKVYSKNRVSTQKELTDLKDLINIYIGIVRKIVLTTNEETHFGSESLVKRNIEYKREAIKSLKSDLKVVKGRIKRIETQEPEARKDSSLEGNLKLLNIPTRLDSDEILDFWFKLTGNNEKGEPYWESETEIEHFVNQNFDVFPGVNEIKAFNPNMNKSELNHVTWTFQHNHGMSKTKKQYEKLLMLNFTKFKDDKNVYSNIKDQNNEHLKKLFK